MTQGSAKKPGTDHGLLLGLGDDDHVQYILADATRRMSGNTNDFGLVIEGTDDTIGGMAVLHLVNAAGGTHDEDAWQIHHRGLSGAEGDLIIYYKDDSAGPTWTNWLQFDYSGDEIFFKNHFSSNTVRLNLLSQVGTDEGSEIEFKGGSSYTDGYRIDRYQGFFRFLTDAAVMFQVDTTGIDMSGKTIRGLGDLTFTGTDIWSIDSTGGDDFQIEENGAVRFRIRDDDNDGFYEFFGTSGLEIARMDADNFSIRGPTMYFDSLVGNDYISLPEGSNYGRMVLDGNEKWRVDTASKVWLGTFGHGNQAGGYGRLFENSDTVISGNASNEIYFGGLGVGNFTNVSASGTQIFSNTSNTYKKKDFDYDMPWLSSIIELLKPVSFEWRDEWNASDRRFVWMTVEEVQAAARTIHPDAEELFIHRDPLTNEPNDIDDAAISMAMLRKLQEMDARMVAAGI